MNDGVVVSPREASAGASGSRCAVISKPTTKRGLFHSIKWTTRKKASKKPWYSVAAHRRGESIKESTSTSFFLGFERYCTIYTSHSPRKENGRVHTTSHHTTPHNALTPLTTRMVPLQKRSIVASMVMAMVMVRARQIPATDDRPLRARERSRCIALLNRLPYVSCSRCGVAHFLGARMWSTEGYIDTFLLSSTRRCWWCWWWWCWCESSWLWRWFVATIVVAEDLSLWYWCNILILTDLLQSTAFLPSSLLSWWLLIVLVGVGVGWCSCWFLWSFFSSLPWGISEEHTVVRPLLLSTLRLVFLVRIFEWIILCRFDSDFFRRWCIWPVQ